MFGIPDNFLKQAQELFSKNGHDQREILIEECAELIKALCKINRQDTNISHADGLHSIIEEITHVLISSAMVAQQYGIVQEDILSEVSLKAKKYGIEL